MDINFKKCGRCTAKNKIGATKCYACGSSLDVNTKGWSAKGTKVGISDSAGGGDSLCDAVDIITDATVRITCRTAQSGSLGTGFFVEEKGKSYLVSNYHVVQNVVEEGGLITVRFPDHINPRKDNYHAFPIAVDRVNDLALLEVQFEISKNVVPLPLATMSSLRRGQQVVAVGNPRGMDFNCITGIIANENLRDEDYSMSRILCSLNAAPGNSGGPVVRVSDRKVIGVATAIFHPDYMQSHTICTSADALRQMIYMYERKNKQ